MLKEFDINKLCFNPFERIGNDWCLISAGDENGYNTMTASWGGVGVLWSKNVATVYIRPQRYTKKFFDEADTFTLTFFPDGYRSALAFCGKYSGRDYDKAKETGITPWFVDKSVAFEEADLVLVCKKLYAQEMSADSFVDKDVLRKNYPYNDLHTVYVGEIVKAYCR